MGSGMQRVLVAADLMAIDQYVSNLRADSE